MESNVATDRLLTWAEVFEQPEGTIFRRHGPNGYRGYLMYLTKDRVQYFEEGQRLGSERITSPWRTGQDIWGYEVITDTRVIAENLPPNTEIRVCVVVPKTLSWAEVTQLPKGSVVREESKVTSRLAVVGPHCILIRFGEGFDWVPADSSWRNERFILTNEEFKL